VLAPHKTRESQVRIKEKPHKGGTLNAFIIIVKDKEARGGKEKIVPEVR